MCAQPFYDGGHDPLIRGTWRSSWWVTTQAGLDGPPAMRRSAANSGCAATDVSGRMAQPMPDAHNRAWAIMLLTRATMRALASWRRIISSISLTPRGRVQDSHGLPGV